MRWIAIILSLLVLWERGFGIGMERGLDGQNQETESSAEAQSVLLWREKSETAFLEEQAVREKLAMEISDAFDTRSRRSDPFGFSEDAADSLDTMFKISERGKAGDRLKEVLHTLKFTGVSPSRKELFLESRILRAGQCLVMRFQGQEVEARLVSVSVQQAIFENPANGTQYAIPLQIAPETKTFGGNKYVR